MKAFIRSLSLLLLLFMLSLSAIAQRSHQAAEIDLLKAIDQSKIQCKAAGGKDNEQGHFGKCMRMKVTSTTDEPVAIKIPNGLILRPEDEKFQDMIVTKTEHITLEPGTHQIVTVYAMCTQKHDHGPNPKMKYAIHGKSKGSLAAISKATESLAHQDNIGQHAVWAFTDKITKKECRQALDDEASFLQTVKILNKAGVHTLLNPIKVAPVVQIDTVPPTPEVPCPALVQVPVPTPAPVIVASPDTTPYWIAGGATLLLLAGAGVWASTVRKSKQKTA